MAQFKADYTDFFKEENFYYIRAEKRLMKVKEGNRKDPAPKNAKTTIAKKGFDHWGVNTDETRKNAFESDAGKDFMEVRISNKQHSGRTNYVTKRGKKGSSKHKNPPTYKQLFEGIPGTGQRGGNHPMKEGLNAIHRYSGLMQEFPVGSKVDERFADETHKQIYNWILREIPRRF